MMNIPPKETRPKMVPTPSTSPYSSSKECDWDFIFPFDDFPNPTEPVSDDDEYSPPSELNTDPFGNFRTSPSDYELSRGMGKPMAENHNNPYHPSQGNLLHVIEYTKRDFNDIMEQSSSHTVLPAGSGKDIPITDGKNNLNQVPNVNINPAKRKSDSLPKLQNNRGTDTLDTKSRPTSDPSWKETKA
ncbi:hypothetical protein K469DRAFT_692142 [Zopfia rhizophila CBS 207.26]|uniref:Uncharacterized protein n=1 Tax=Zopfia rhizophila CBS 207.26 TaxID=1314779 RepID=A0A6A6DNX4_9PEZI|nr:hypothetical protein K469DRAFT_692142 [Zopfia rhizophila CBS 207.26]